MTLNPAPIEEITGPRHAQVLPSFAANLMKRRMQVNGEKVSGEELLAWRGTLPNYIRANAIRNKFVKGHRPRFEILCNSPIGVHLRPGWEGSVTPIYQTRLRAAIDSLTDASQFPKLTLRQLKELLRMPVAELLELLAKLESSYWTAEHSNQLIQKPLHPETPLQMLAVTDEWLADVNIVLQAGWVDRVSDDDLRFGGTGQQSIGTWMRETIAQSSVSETVVALGNALVRANMASWTQELEELAQAALSHTKRRPGNNEARQRWVRIFLAKLRGPRPRTLQEVGDEFSLTRERVRQICSTIEDALAANAVATPALDKLLAAAARIAPVTAEQADHELSKLLGSGTGIYCALEFAEVLGKKPDVIAGTTNVRTPHGIEHIPMIRLRDQASDWMTKAIQAVRKDCRGVGCSNYVRIAGIMSLDEGVVIDQRELEGLLEAVPGYRVLDKEGGWFTVALGEETAIANRLKKLFAVASQSITVDDLLIAAVTDDRWLQLAGRGLCIPPIHVLIQLVSSWTWLHKDRHNKMRPIEPIAPQAVLTEIELLAIEVIVANDGVATRSDLAKVIVADRGWTNVALSFALGSSPVFMKIEHSIYRVAGRTLSAPALVEARLRRDRELRQANEVVLDEINTDEPLRITLTQAAGSAPAQRRVIYLPKQYREHVRGAFTQARGAGPSINVSSAQQILRLSAFAESRGVAPGEAFDVIFDVNRRTYEFMANSAPTDATHFPRKENDHKAQAEPTE